METVVLILCMVVGLVFVGQGTEKLFGWVGDLGTTRSDLTVAEPAAAESGCARGAPWLVPVSLCATDALALSVALVATGAFTSPLGLAYVAAAVATIAASDGYRSRITLSALQVAPWLCGRLAFPLVLLAPLALLAGAHPSVLVLPMVGMVAVVLGRALAYAAVRRARRAGHLLEGTVIVGAGTIGVELARIFDEHPEYGVHPVGFLDRVDGDGLPLPLLGDVDRLDPLLEQGEIRRVVVAFGPAREADLVNILRVAVQHNAELHVVPRFFDIGVAPAGPGNDDVRGIPLHRMAMRLKAASLKRAVDIVVASALLALSAPVLALTALVVRRTSPGPVLFSQDRVGRGGRVFRMHKFRTMVDGADARRDGLGDLNERDGAVFKIRNDPRCTPVGRWLRRFSVDELPQLWHVLTGDMTLVGPRPAVPSEVARYDDDARWRLMVKPGLTGLWQVSGRSDLRWAESLRLDLYYIYNWTPGLDVTILGRTLAAVVRHQGAY